MHFHHSHRQTLPVLSRLSRPIVRSPPLRLSRHSSIRRHFCSSKLRSHITVRGHIILISSFENSNDDSYPSDWPHKLEERIENLEKQMDQNWMDVKMGLKDMALEFQKQFHDSEIRFEKHYPTGCSASLLL